MGPAGKRQGVQAPLESTQCPQHIDAFLTYLLVQAIEGDLSTVR